MKRGLENAECPTAKKIQLSSWTTKRLLAASTRGAEPPPPPKLDAQLNNWVIENFATESVVARQNIGEGGRIALPTPHGGDSIENLKVLLSKAERRIEEMTIENQRLVKKLADNHSEHRGEVQGLLSRISELEQERLERPDSCEGAGSHIQEQPERSGSNDGAEICAQVRPDSLTSSEGGGNSTQERAGSSNGAESGTQAVLERPSLMDIRPEANPPLQTNAAAELGHIPPYSMATVVGLEKNPQLNGRMVEVLSFSGDVGRYRVELYPDGAREANATQYGMLRRENLEPIHPEAVSIDLDLDFERSLVGFIGRVAPPEVGRKLYDLSRRAGVPDGTELSNFILQRPHIFEVQRSSHDPELSPEDLVCLRSAIPIHPTEMNTAYNAPAPAKAEGERAETVAPTFHSSQTSTPVPLYSMATVTGLEHQISVNGKLVEILSFNAARGRYRVEFRDHDDRVASYGNLLRSNLLPVADARSVTLEEHPDRGFERSTVSFLQWKAAPVAIDELLLRGAPPGGQSLVEFIRERSSVFRLTPSPNDNRDTLNVHLIHQPLTPESNTVKTLFPQAASMAPGTGPASQAPMPPNASSPSDPEAARIAAKNQAPVAPCPTSHLSQPLPQTLSVAALQAIPTPPIPPAHQRAPQVALPMVPVPPAVPVAPTVPSVAVIPAVPTSSNVPSVTSRVPIAPKGPTIEAVSALHQVNSTSSTQPTPAAFRATLSVPESVALSQTPAAIPNQTASPSNSATNSDSTVRAEFDPAATETRSPEAQRARSSEAQRDSGPKFSIKVGGKLLTEYITVDRVHALENGYVFDCKHSSRSECIDRRLFAGPQSQLRELREISRNTVLFLRNVSNSTISGPFYPSLENGRVQVGTLDSRAFGGQFQAQVRVQVTGTETTMPFSRTVLSSKYDPQLSFRRWLDKVTCFELLQQLKAEGKQ